MHLQHKQRLTIDIYKQKFVIRKGNKVTAAHDRIINQSLTEMVFK